MEELKLGATGLLHPGNTGRDSTGAALWIRPGPSSISVPKRGSQLSFISMLTLLCGRDKTSVGKPPSQDRTQGDQRVTSLTRSPPFPYASSWAPANVSVGTPLTLGVLSLLPSAPVPFVLLSNVTKEPHFPAHRMKHG